MVATSFKLLGVTSIAARLPVALTSVAGVVAVYHYVRVNFGRVEAFAASLTSWLAGRMSDGGDRVTSQYAATESKRKS